MRKGKAKIFLTGIVMMAALLCFSSQAQGAQEGNYTYMVTDDAGAQVTGYIGGDSEVSIPPVLGGTPVTGIGNQAFSDCVGLRTVIIPMGVTTIGEGAFSGCRDLKNITIPVSVTSIGDAAFAYCINLRSINLPPNVALLGEDTFKGCANLTSITYGSTPRTIYDQAYRRVMTASDGYSKIIATIALPSREQAEDLNITYDNGAAAYSYLGCRGAGDEGSSFDFEFGFGFKPLENKMMQFGLFYSLKAGSGEDAIKEWKWMRPESGNQQFFGFGYGTTHQIHLTVEDEKIEASIYDANGNLEFRSSWRCPGPKENGTNQVVRKVTSLLVPQEKSASAKNYIWITTNIGQGETLQVANGLNSKATTSTSGDEGWITVVTDSEFNQETVSFDIE